MNINFYGSKALACLLLLIFMIGNGFAQKSGNVTNGKWHDDLLDESGNKIFPEEGDAIQNSIFSGIHPFSKFGSSVSNAGDVNADGFDDIIVGAPECFSNNGQVYIYFGALSIDVTPDLILNGNNSQSFFGCSVSCAGDVNADGFDDVVIGAKGNNSNFGKAMIYFGSNSMDTIPDVILTGQSINDKFGISVSNAGDIDNDGHDDVIVGADTYNNSAGYALIFRGGTNMDNISDVQFYGIASNIYYGHCVSGAGDVNGDNYDDIIIGAYGVSNSSGSAEIYYGSSSMDNTADVAISGVPNSYFGRSVSNAGDVNNDGYSDVIVGGDYDGLNTGFAKIYFGSGSMDNVSDVNLTGENSADKFGWCVSDAGDMNGDGFDDVISGAPGYVSGKGKMYVYYGSVSVDQYSDIIKSSETTSAYLGYSVASSGDFNGDGYNDILAGAYGMNISMGKVFFYQYRTDPPRTLADLTLTGSSGSGFGVLTSDAGDVNNDGYSDLLVSAPWYNGSGGRIYIFFGGTIMDNYPDFIKSGSYTEAFGSSISGAGDVNGDGYDDIIVGTDNLYANNDGNAKIFLGGANMDTIADVTMYEQENSSRYAQTVSNSGDINSDGYDDVIVGAMDANGFVGKAYIYHGGANMNNEIDMILSGSSSPSQFGHCFAPAKDINGDGYPDLVVGARMYNSSKGRAYIYYGGVSMDNVPDVLLDGLVTGEEFGSSIDAGDINGDGFTDVICGAPFYNSYTGRIFLFYGDPSMDNIADKIFAGDTANGYFGGSLTSSDFNNDGYDDLIAPSKISYLPGKVNFYYGNEDISTTSQLSINGGPYFGRVSSAKDLNGDNVPDFTISQNYSSDYVFIYFSRPEGNSKLTIYGAIQGLYDASTDIEIPDTITVKLRNNLSPYTIIDTARNVLLGPLAGQDFHFGKIHNTVPYYVEVRHRNAIETWSANPVMFSNQQTSIAFSADAIYAYGNNEILVDTNPYNVYAFYSGDVNQDGTVDLSDIASCFNDATAFVSGYVNTDLNGDYLVDLTDIALAFNNSNNFVSKVTP